MASRAPDRNPDPDGLTLDLASERSGFTVKELAEAVMDGRLPCVKRRGKAHRVTPAELERFCAEEHRREAERGLL